MVFENLAEKLQNSLNKLKGKGKLTEKDVSDAMREVKLALLEADVNFKVVKQFIKTVKERSIGSEVMESLTPGQQVIKIVNEELTKLMGETESKLELSGKPAVIMLCGLQGAGKTTASGKLASLLKKKGKRPLLVACDVYRPAAIKQLQVVGEKVGVPVFSMGDKESPVKIAAEGIAQAKENNNDLVIVDTAGRLHIDDNLMEELEEIKASVNPCEILLVVDAMTGQDAVSVAQTFNDRLSITGTILSKLDGDARGGAALSIREVTGSPIKFIGVGEKLDESALEVFYPDRMASRILGMGDMLSLIEKAQANYDEKKALELEQKIKDQSFTFDDFLDQMQQMKKMGSLTDIIGMLPGVNSKQLKNLNVDDKEISRVEAIILSMTKQERANPEIIDASRRKRIARGSGMKVQDVNRLLKQFKETKKMMKQFAGMEKMMKKKGKKGKFGLNPFR
ncbi:MAG: signal recognition particle protein [Tissierellales bacterium]|jgi:signal recognition particle subunit SRP54|nr:signal recognition particle protein [Tissierellales bacterium]